MQISRTRQLAAIVALALYLAFVVLVLWLLARNLGMVIVLGATFMILVYAGWLQLAGAKRQASIGLWLEVVAGLALAIELIYFLADQKNRRAIIAGAALALLYMAAVTALRKRYWLQARRLGEQRGDTAHFAKPYLIINPKSGDGRAIKAHIEELAAQQGVQIVMTRKGDDVGALAEKAANAGADVLGISGGDGSIGAVAKVALKHALPMVVLPGGTRCHFARDLGLDPERIADALAGFRGIERRVDVAEINGRVFLNNASFGLYADIVDHPDYRANKVQVTRQVLREVINGTKQPYDLRLAHDSQRITQAVQVLVGVNRYNTRNMFELGHRDHLDAGLLQVMVLTKLDSETVRSLMRSASLSQFSKQGHRQNYYEWTDHSLQIAGSGKKLVVGVDGEREEYSSPVVLQILPSALSVYVPAEGVRPRPKNPFSTLVTKRVWQAVRRPTAK